MSLDRPIFILAPPRTGTTLVYKTLCAHPDVAFVSRGYKKFPNAPVLAELLTRLGIVSAGPKEARRVWNRFQKATTDVAGAADATPELRDWYRRFVTRLVALRGKKRFVAKLPGLSLRAHWLDAVFPGCLFIVLSRDWRAVVASTVLMREEHAGDELPFWGIKVPGYAEMKETMGSAESAARVYRIVYEALEKDAAAFPGRVVHVAYEDLCRDIGGEMRRVTDACGLPWSAEFEATLPAIRPDTNAKWRGVLDDGLVARIRAAEGGRLERYEHASAH